MLPEGHLPAEENVDWFLGLATNAAVRAGLSEKKFERVLGVPPGTLDGIERGTRLLDQPLVRLVWMFYYHPELARR
jgi:hypothetical protein